MVLIETVVLEIDILFLLQVSAFALRVSGTRVFTDECDPVTHCRRAWIATGGSH